MVRKARSYVGTALIGRMGMGLGNPHWQNARLSAKTCENDIVYVLNIFMYNICRIIIFIFHFVI